MDQENKPENKTIPELKFVIKGTPITKKNHSKIIRNPKTGAPMLKPSDQYDRYERLALWQLPSLPEPIDIPINLKYICFMPTRRTVDKTNLEESICDILVEAKILKDDCVKYVASTDGSRVYIDRENPRVEITITPFLELESEYETFWE